MGAVRGRAGGSGIEAQRRWLLRNVGWPGVAKRGVLGGAVGGQTGQWRGVVWCGVACVIMELMHWGLCHALKHLGTAPGRPIPTPPLHPRPLHARPSLLAQILPCTFRRHGHSPLDRRA